MNATKTLGTVSALLVGVLAAGCSSGGSTEPSPAEPTGTAGGAGTSDAGTSDAGTADAETADAETARRGSSDVIPSGEQQATGSPATDRGDGRLPDGWTADEITFEVDGTTVYGTFLHPADQASVPAAVLIAGSGPTDRDGNSPAIPGTAGTLEFLANTLADNGVATLRYDKVGSGKTGLGTFADRPGDIGFADFADQARGALRFLADSPGIDADRLSAYGHSEGALFALQLAAEPADGDPELQAVGLLEPLALRYLDLITQQVATQVETQQEQGLLTEQQADQALEQLQTAVDQLRSDGTVPDDLSFGLDTLFNPGTLRFLQEADQVDPSALAAGLPASMPVLLSCSDADLQVSCDDVAGLADTVPGPAELVRLTSVNHVLKKDPSGNPAGYGKDLPFSAELGRALADFAGR